LATTSCRTRVVGAIAAEYSCDLVTLDRDFARLPLGPPAALDR
jgi:hypothetical protein